MADVRDPDVDADLAAAIEALSFGLVAVTARAIDEARPDHALTFQQWRILVILGATPDGARIGRVAERIGASRPSTSRLVRRLALRGLVEVGVDPADRRAARLRLTEAGSDLRESVIRRRRALIQETLADGAGRQPSASSVALLAAAFDRWV